MHLLFKYQIDRVRPTFKPEMVQITIVFIYPFAIDNLKRKHAINNSISIVDGRRRREIRSDIYDKHGNLLFEIITLIFLI